MPTLIRKSRTLHLPITLSVVLMSLNIALMVCWIIFLAQGSQWSALTVGTVLFALILVGLTFYLVLSIKSVRLHQRQINFVDSVTHELKSPIASLRLYIDTLRMRQELDAEQRTEFYETMARELSRLEELINQLLEVGRLERLGEETSPEDVALEPLLRKCAENACKHHQVEFEPVFAFDAHPAFVHARPMLLEMIFGNLLDNAVKYGGDEPSVEVEVRVHRRRVVTRIADSGPGVPPEQRKKIFDLFYRGGNELQRTRKGTGLGLYIVRTLVHILRGHIHVYNRYRKPGSIFEVELPGREG
ncbi:sensor histidine kinase [Stratiformator vulcanicus]|uniref:histidine kinase n=1 Tax=Stratiformator vulcanicus TaxID=2527980 RepID=A0A517R3W6_9PLAN|nr:HAMP domain-containing sensor histidine kinase [Stratiformator vulcanicus]QDT38533.1 Alkaline phosphatase synthesis sensor protein PhoR [Stratiformator vulcanicus]